MKRPVIRALAALLAAAQLAFGCFLMTRGKSADRAQEEEIEAILADGTEYLLLLKSFQLPHSEKDEFRFELQTEGKTDGFRYAPLVRRGEGIVRYLGDGTDEPPADDAYLDLLEGKIYYRMDADALRAVCGTQKKAFMHALVLKDKFEIDGRFRTVFAVAKAKGGSLVFTGLAIDGTRYGELG